MTRSADRGGGDVVRLDSVRKVYGSQRNGTVALDGVTIGFARVFFGDRLSGRRLIGLVLLVIGTLLPVVIL